jgi:hypothetical protein
MALGIAVNTSLISGLDFKNFNTGGQVRLLARNDQDDYIVMNSFGSAATGTLFGQNRTNLQSIFTSNTSDSDKKLAIGTLSAGDLILGTNNVARITIGATTGVINFSNSIELPYVTKTANYTLTDSDYTVNCTANTFTVTLPTAVGITGRIYNVKNSGTGLITLDAHSTETIDGALTQDISQWESLQVQSTSTGWIIL